MEQNENWAKQWRENTEKRLDALEGIKLSVANYHLDVLRLITDERDRRRDQVEELREQVVKAHTAIGTLKWVGGLVSAALASAFLLWDHITKKP